MIEVTMKRNTIMNSDVRTMIAPDSVSQFFIEGGSMDFIGYFL
jgi:hypothetical protein